MHRRQILFLLLVGLPTVILLHPSRAAPTRWWPVMDEEGADGSAERFESPDYHHRYYYDYDHQEPDDFPNFSPTDVGDYIYRGEGYEDTGFDSPPFYPDEPFETRDEVSRGYTSYRRHLGISGKLDLGGGNVLSVRYRNKGNDFLPFLMAFSSRLRDRYCSLLNIASNDGPSYCDY